MKRIIVTTTINPPTEAIKKFDEMKDWILIVAGDKKTPRNYKLKRGIYLAPEVQEKYDKKLSDLIGWNCIQRRNFGFLWANDLEADVIAVVDDDNIPLKNWGHNLMIGKKVTANYYETNLLAFDPVGATNEKRLWHRGYPLQLLSSRNYSKKKKKVIFPDIQADFWNGDPDIDAICRMEYAPECKFNDRYFPIASNKISPFNSQNTFLSKKVLRDYFLLPQVGRMDDIWASYYVQSLGYKVVYGKPSVHQRRNVHDLTKDMKAEFLGYENNLNIVEKIIHDPDMIRNLVPAKPWRAFKLYKKHFK
jgi:hypothetical protein